MNEYDLYKSHLRKLKDFCDAAELDCTVVIGNYPITMEIRPKAGYSQLSILDERPIGCDPNALIRFTLEEDEVEHRVYYGFAISKSRLNKLDNLFQKICAAYLQYFFRTLIQDESLRSAVSEAVVVEDDED